MLNQPPLTWRTFPYLHSEIMRHGKFIIICRSGVGVLFAGLLFSLLVSSSLEAEPLLEKMDLFKGGTDGHVLYRIPGIVVTDNGTVLAYCEARRNSGSDWADSETYLRRSTNGGVSWDVARQIAHFGKRLPRS